MDTTSVTNSSIWMSQQVAPSQWPSQLNGATQGTGGQGGQDFRVHHHHHGGMGKALMETLSQFGLTGESGGAQSAINADSDGDQDGSGVQATGTQNVRDDMRSFMHALFQTVRSQEDGSSPNGSSTRASVGASKFESGLSAIISELGGSSGSDNSQLSDLQDAFNALVQDTQNGQSGSSTSQTSPSLNLQSFLTALQQNLQNSLQPFSSVGNVVDTQT